MKEILTRLPTHRATDIAALLPRSLSCTRALRVGPFPNGSLNLVASFEI
jgi:hypothetical protein